jgi:histone deacetylase 1/2
VCDACQKGKSHQLPYPKSSSVSSSPFELVFSDVWGPAPTSIGRHNYYVSFIDDFTKFTWIYLLRYKSEVFQCFKDFQSMVERQFDRKIIALQSDWGGEYQTINTFFKRLGISHHVSCPHSHQQNGAAERKHRHIVKVGLSLLAHASMPLKYWDESFLTAVFLINRLPSKVINNTTPYERLHASPPDYTFICSFGCAMWPNLRPYNSRKLQFRSKRCVFLGYSNLHKGFKCLDPSEGRVYISRDVVFDEHIFPFSEMHPNVGARLRAELSLLPDILKNLDSSFGDATLHDHTSVDCSSTNAVPSSRGDPNSAGSNLEANDAQIGLNMPYFMLLVQNDKNSTGSEVDPPVPAAKPATPSSSGSASPTTGSPLLSDAHAESSNSSRRARGSSTPPSATSSTSGLGAASPLDPAAGGWRTHAIFSSDLLRAVRLLTPAWRLLHLKQIQSLLQL